MPDRADVKQGTLALMVLKTLEMMGPLHRTALPAVSNRSAGRSSSSTTAPSIPRCSSSSRKATSSPPGYLGQQP